jgi:hypothetical protein
MRKKYMFHLVFWLVTCIFHNTSQAEGYPKALKGKIITSAKAIRIPTKSKNFLAALKRQDRMLIKSNRNKWTIYFVAFFRNAPPIRQIGAVVLDPDNEAVGVIKLDTDRGQKTLAAKIVVDSTEYQGKQHQLQIYYAKDNKPILLAKKAIVLR